jgi:large subunit ribosomal protein L21
MYAIVETSGKQYRVSPGDTLTVDRMGAEVGSTVVLDRVLLVHGDEVRVGTPLIGGATVTAKVTDHPLGDKVRTFKYVRTRRHRRRVGFRHSHTTLEIIGIQG